MGVEGRTAQPTETCLRGPIGKLDPRLCFAECGSSAWLSLASGGAESSSHLHRLRLLSVQWHCALQEALSCSQGEVGRSRQQPTQLPGARSALWKCQVKPAAFCTWHPQKDTLLALSCPSLGRGIQRVSVRTVLSASRMKACGDFVLLPSAQCLCEAVPQAVTSAACAFWGSPSDLRAGACGKGTQRAHADLYAPAVQTTVRFSQPEQLFVLSVSALSRVILEEGGFVHFVSPFLLTAYYFPCLCVVF